MEQPVDFFFELAAIASPPGEERAAADIVARYLRELGLDHDEDSFGNLYVRIDGTTDGTPLFFCAHLDTVPPDGELRPVLEHGVVRNAGGTILGADNKAAVVQMLEGVRRILAENRPHAGIELLFTMQEEIGLLGAAAFDHTRLRAKFGYVYDQAAPIGEIILGAPWARELTVTFHGRASHSGISPDTGRSAIHAAAKAIADLRLGRVDEETTANVGVIRGGAAGNIVPEWCTFLVEARSQDQAKLDGTMDEMIEAFRFAAVETECDVETASQEYSGYRLMRDDDVVQLAAGALKDCRRTISYALSGGGTDANVFNERGLRCVNLANGMADVHTPDEHISVADLEGMIDVTVALIERAADRPGRALTTIESAM